MYHNEFLHFVLLHVHTELQSSLLLLQKHFFIAHFPLQEHKFFFSVPVSDAAGKAGLLKRIRMAATTSSFAGFWLPCRYFSTKEHGSVGNIFFACFLAFFRVLYLHLNLITSSRISFTYPKNIIIHMQHGIFMITLSIYLSLFSCIQYT